MVNAAAGVVLKMALFKPDSIRKILEGTKVQTRRLHKRGWKVGKTYAIRTTWFEKGKVRILILRRFRERLGDISLEDVKKEGFETLTQFQAAWIRINHKWAPDAIVTAYEFRLFGSSYKRLSRQVTEEETIKR